MPSLLIWYQRTVLQCLPYVLLLHRDAFNIMNGVCVSVNTWQYYYIILSSPEVPCFT